jgi:hypothetical protein
MSGKRTLLTIVGCLAIVLIAFAVTTYVLNLSASSTNTASSSAPPAASPRVVPPPVAQPSVAATGPGENLIWPSENFADPSWRRLDIATIQPAAATAPNGNNVASKLVEAATNARHFINHGVTGVTAGEVHTFSVYVKPAERSTIRMEIFDSPKGKYGNAVCNLPQPDGTGGGIAKVGDIVGGGVEAAADGWFRCWAAMPYSTTNASVGIEMRGSNGAFGYQGDGHSGLLIWGAQFERGNRPTTYTMTSTGPVAKAN